MKISPKKSLRGLLIGVVYLMGILGIVASGGGGGGGGGGDDSNDTVKQLIDGLIAQYSFDESLGNVSRDESGLENHGRISGASRVTGYFGEGLRFGHENSHIRYESSLIFNSGLITIDAWIKADVIEAGKIYRIIGGYDYYGLYFQIRDGRLEVLDEGQSYHYGNATIQPGIWTHVAFMSDGTNVIAYINGVEDSRTNVTLPVGRFDNINIGANEVYVGCPPCSDHIEEFPGIIDEVRIWDVARFQADISGDHNIQLINPKSATIDVAYWAGWYTFDEISGNIANDDSGLDNHGTIVAASRVAGYSGNGLLFGADNARIDIPDSVTFMDGVISIGTWIKPTTIEAGKVYRIIGGYDYYGLYFQIRDGRLEVLFDGQSYHYGTVSIQPGVWSRIEFASDGKHVITYIDDIEEARTNITLPIWVFENINIGANEVYVGCPPCFDHIEEFPGIIDELEMAEGVLAFN